MSGVCPATGKQRYRTQVGASRGSRAIQQKGSPSAHPYHCSDCHAWHVGTGRFLEPGKPKPPRARREDVPTPAGTVHCQRRGCGHPAPTHGHGICIGAHGACECIGLVAP
jgi:hypothetical protein